MVLIHCPECNEQISDKAKVCPYCGYPVTPRYTDRANNQESYLYKVVITGYRNADTEIISALKKCTEFRDRIFTSTKYYKYKLFYRRL